MAPCHLAVFGVDVAFGCHFVATSLISTFSPYGSANGISYTSKNLSRMAGNSVSYPLNR